MRGKGRRVLRERKDARDDKEDRESEGRGVAA